MTLVDHATRIGRLSVLFNLREVTAPSVLAAVGELPPGRPLLVGASATGTQLDLVLPFDPGALAILAPTAIVPTGPGTLGLRVRVEGASVATAVTMDGPITPHAALDELAQGNPAREAWRFLLEQFCSIAGGRITGRGRWTGEPARAFVQVVYPPRDVPTEAFILAGVDQLAGDVGVTGAQRRLWTQIHGKLGSSAGELAVETAIGPAGISPHLALTYPIPDWGLATELAQALVFNDFERKALPARLGQIAGALGAEQLTSVSLVLGPHEPPEVIVWAQLALAG